jgi:hypothetical protein
MEADRARGDAIDPRARRVAFHSCARDWMRTRELAPRATELRASGRASRKADGREHIDRARHTGDGPPRYSDGVERAGALQAAKRDRLPSAIFNTAVDEGLIARIRAECGRRTEAVTRAASRRPNGS